MWTAAVLLAAAGVLRGCYTPPAVMAAGTRAFDAEAFLPDVERVDLVAAPGILLRGVQVKPPPGRPVVLHLLEAMASITDGARPMGSISIGGDPDQEHPMFSQMVAPEAGQWPDESVAGKVLRLQHRWLSRLRLLGLGGLVVDYEGVGASDGERHPDHLRRDARAAWEHAVALAGGNEQLVILRGTSLGVLAAASLLQDGARPGAVILINPIRAETAAGNFVAHMRHPMLGSLAHAFTRDLLDVDLLDVLGAVDAPLLVISPRSDFLLPADEAELVRAAVERAGGTFLHRRMSHEGLSVSSRDFLAVELAFFERVFPATKPGRLEAALASARADGVPEDVLQPGAPARAHLERLLTHTVLPTPRLSVAVALAEVPHHLSAAVGDWLAWLPPARLDGLALPELTALLDLADPDGSVSLQWVEEDPSGHWSGAPRTSGDVLALFSGTVRTGKHVEMSWSMDLVTGRLTVSDLGAVTVRTFIEMRRVFIEDRGLPHETADRLTVRSMLKAACLPDRVITSADGVHTLEVFEQGAWRELALP